MPGIDAFSDKLSMLVGGASSVGLLINIVAIVLRMGAVQKHPSRREVNRQKDERKKIALRISILAICATAILLTLVVNIAAGIAFAVVAGLILVAFVFFFSTQGKNSDWFTGHTTGHSSSGRGM